MGILSWRKPQRGTNPEKSPNQAHLIQGAGILDNTPSATGTCGTKTGLLSLVLAVIRDTKSLVFKWFRYRGVWYLEYLCIHRTVFIEEVEQTWQALCFAQP